MQKLVIIGANDFQNQLIKKANSLGYETHVFAWEDGAVGKEEAFRFYPISIVEKERIAEICREIAPVGVCSIASDLASITVNYVSHELGLPCNDPAYIEIQTNKYAMRKALMDAGIPCPAFVKADENFDEKELRDFRFPIIVKPTDRSGSRCIMKLESTEGLYEAVRNACEVSFEHKAIIEEYIGGEEYSMETISRGGKHHYLATTKKFTTGEPFFIETGHRQPSGLPEEINEKAKNTVLRALDALHVENSAGHSEFKVDEDGNVNIIEIGARMGGDCIGSDLVMLSTGYDYMKSVIDTACGNDLDPVTAGAVSSASIRFIFNRNDIDRMNSFKEANPEKIYRISDMELENMGSTVDSSTRVGYYIFKE